MRSSFRLPSRAEIWDKIPSTPSGKSSYTHLKPCKLVNKFTVQNSRYNYDPVYTSGEDSIQEFVVEDNEISSDDSDSSAISAEDQDDDPDNNEKVEKEATSSDDSGNNNDGVESDGSSKEYGRRLKKKQTKRKRIKIVESSSEDEGMICDHCTTTEDRVADKDVKDKLENPKKSLKYRAFINYIQAKNLQVHLPFQESEAKPTNDRSLSGKNHISGSDKDKFQIKSDSDSSSSHKSIDFVERSHGNTQNTPPRRDSPDKRLALKDRFAGFKAFRKQTVKNNVK